MTVVVIRREPFNSYTLTEVNRIELNVNTISVYGKQDGVETVGQYDRSKVLVRIIDN